MKILVMLYIIIFLLRPPLILRLSRSIEDEYDNDLLYYFVFLNKTNYSSIAV
jgi:hypothetical protein